MQAADPQATGFARPPGIPLQQHPEPQPPEPHPPEPEREPEPAVDLAARRSNASAPNASTIAALREVVPDASLLVCHHVLHRSAGSVDEAVELLVTTPLDDLEAAAAEEEARSIQAAAQDARNASAARRRTVNRYAQVAESADGSPLKIEPPRLPYTQSRKEAMKGPSLRYREGQVTSTKGGKFLVEEKEEWDGGSRGRVKTKGKRGPAYQ